jgi:hypothetical protein
VVIFGDGDVARSEMSKDGYYDEVGFAGGEKED